jgi:uncharacterized protein (TIGR03437 family)
MYCNTPGLGRMDHFELGESVMPNILRYRLCLVRTVLVLAAGSLWGQSGSIVTTPAPVFGPAVFDAAGSLYFYESGPVTPGAAQTANGGGTCLGSNGFFSTPGPCPDAYAGKVDVTGTQVFGTYLGGETEDRTTALAVDTAGSVYIVGSTGGSFPTTANAAIRASATSKTFAAKLAADGSRFWYVTYLPPTVASANAIAVDKQGNAYVAGNTVDGQAMVLKLSADGSTVVYTTAFGGSGQTAARAIYADALGSVAVAGDTTSADFPIATRAVQARLKGVRNLFLTRLDTDGRATASTYLGGSATDTPSAVRTDAAGNVYVAGQTTSFDFPTTGGSFEPSAVVPLWNNSGPGGFAARLTADLATLSWSTYVMSSDRNPQPGVTHLEVTGTGEAYVAGLAGAGFPVTRSAPQFCFDGTVSSVFVARLDSRGGLADATYVGRRGFAVLALALAADGSVRMASTTAPNTVQSRIRFGDDAWSAPACLSPAVLNSATMFADPAVVPGELVTLTGLGLGPETGVAYQPDAGGRIPVELAGVQVLFDGRPAPVLYAQSRQINALAPVELRGRSQTKIEVAYNRTPLEPVTAQVALYGSPGIFRLRPGVSSQAAAQNQDGLINSPANPAPRGSIVSVWGTGFGVTDPPCATGGLNPPGPLYLAAGLGVLIADGSPPGVPVRYASAAYAGAAPGLPCGVMQINLTVPAYIAAGEYQFFPWSAMEAPGGGTSAVMGTVGVTISVR